MTVTFDDLVKRNAEYAKTATAITLTAELSASAVPSIVIYACLDFRMEPMDFLRIQAGEAFVIRNAGGSVSNNLVDLLFMDIFLQQSLKEVIVIHHDDCGVQHETSKGISAKLKQDFPEFASNIENLDFDMHDPSESVAATVKTDVMRLKNCPFLRKDLHVRGFVYDLKSNRVTEID